MLVLLLLLPCCCYIAIVVTCTLLTLLRFVDLHLLLLLITLLLYALFCPVCVYAFLYVARSRVLFQFLLQFSSPRCCYVLPLRLVLLRCYICTFQFYTVVTFATRLHVAVGWLPTPRCVVATTCSSSLVVRWLQFYLPVYVVTFCYVPSWICTFVVVCYSCYIRCILRLFCLCSFCCYTFTFAPLRSVAFATFAFVFYLYLLFALPRSFYLLHVWILFQLRLFWLVWLPTFCTLRLQVYTILQF